MGKIIIEISGNDVSKLDADAVADIVYDVLDSNGYDVVVSGSEDD